MICGRPQAILHRPTADIYRRNATLRECPKRRKGRQGLRIQSKEDLSVLPTQASPVNEFAPQQRAIAREVAWKVQLWISDQDKSNNKFSTLLHADPLMSQAYKLISAPFDDELLHNTLQGIHDLTTHVMKGAATERSVQLTTAIALVMVHSVSQCNKRATGFHMDALEYMTQQIGNSCKPHGKDAQLLALINLIVPVTKHFLKSAWV